VDPDTASPHAGLLAMVRGANGVVAGDLLPDALGVVARNERTREIELEYAAPYLLSVLAHPAAAPLHAGSIERFDRLFTRAGNLISNGPYALAKRLEQQYIELVRNPHHSMRPPAAVARVQYLPFEEQFAQFTAYRVGQIDLTDIVPASGADIVRDQFPNELHLRPTKDTLYYAFNLRDGPLAESRELREALSTAIMREVVVSQVTQANQPPAYSFVPPMFAGYEPPRLPFAAWEQDAKDAAARALLESAFAGDKPPPGLRVLYNTNDAIRRITVAVTSMWRQTLGVDTELINHEFGVFLQTLRDPTAWDVARLSWRADFDDPYAFLEIFTTGSPNNFVGYADAVYDELLERSHREHDPARRFELLRQAEKRLLDAHAIAPVFFYVDRVLAKPWVDVGARATLKPLPTADLRWR
jgi:oligopeptide transport system substrate-binding protein